MKRSELERMLRMSSREVYGVFDVESNGFRGTSVLSASSIVFDGDGKILDYFNRFYFPEESGIDSGALRVHRLTLERIAYFRREGGYADHFLQDADSWRTSGGDGACGA